MIFHLFLILFATTVATFACLPISVDSVTVEGSSAPFSSTSGIVLRTSTEPRLEFGKYLEMIAKNYTKKWIVDPCPKHKGSANQQEIICYLYEISNKNKDFLLTVRAENGTLDPFRKSIIVGANGYSDFGLCQLNRQYHLKFLESPDYKDWKKQAEYCYNVFKNRPTAFYGYYKREEQKKYFIFPS